jgi:hypothetical protein
VGATLRVVGEWRSGERGTGNQGWGPGLSSCFAVIGFCVRASVRQENFEMAGERVDWTLVQVTAGISA